MPRTFVLALVLLVAAFGFVSAQQVPETPEAKTYASYEELFDDFDKQREVLLTKWDRLREQRTVTPEELAAVENELKALDARYAASLEAYIGANADAKDVMPARFELIVSLSRLEDRLERAVAISDDFIRLHDDSELIADVRFIRGQTLFRIEGREADALQAFDDFLKLHADRSEADPVRMLRVRTLMFLNRVADARRSLTALLASDIVKEDEDARAFLTTQVENLDWIGRDLPEFKLTDLAGKPQTKADLAGKPSLILVWDSTRPACLGELPFVQEAFKRYGEKLNFLSIGVNESKPALEQWLARNEDAIKFPTVWIDRDEENSLIKKLNIGAIPFLILVDAEGKIFRYDVRSDDMLRYTAAMAK